MSETFHLTSEKKEALKRDIISRLGVCDTEGEEGPLFPTEKPRLDFR